ncbi:MAG: ATPase [Kordiimonadaceae bacterium]|jgi:chaperone required for assembly of F1-ATPase|nr:ATPase [Kordiimonadaceae bacterium]MBT6037077.1 ATPase [Kordiimonadaceae bacterium]MBT6328974.1 ATPase [Kordiimonadaceae bacterium]
MKRFYKQVSVSDQDGLFSVLLDGKPIKTPEKSPCQMPNKSMAEAVAKEWDEQEVEITPANMPITKLVNTAIDRVDKRRAALTDELVEYAGSDQLCYRAEEPIELIEQQNKVWDPLLKRMNDLHDIELKLAGGIIFVEQEKSQLSKIRTLIDVMESFPLTAFYGMTTVTGSVTIGLNLFEGHITVDEAWEAGQLDENFQISKWGSDFEAEERRKNLKAELINAAYFLDLSKA